jgi:hypothetical protein
VDKKKGLAMAPSPMEQKINVPWLASVSKYAALDTQPGEG